MKQVNKVASKKGSVEWIKKLRQQSNFTLIFFGSIENICERQNHVLQDVFQRGDCGLMASFCWEIAKLCVLSLVLMQRDLNLRHVCKEWKKQ